MMKGISAWQQQVPLPQSYTGANVWRLPLFPVPAREPADIRDRFLRGAIAIAANGIPIFNPQNNRGEISFDIGELDEWGGHCGRADDYHYHAAPLHLQTVLGAQLPIAYALDGYPIYGLAEPDGSEPRGLDAFNGHTTAALGYHYHASNKYPFVNGGFHGEVVERDGQVDPQPRATPVRPALQQMRGARITDFKTAADGKTRTLTYDVAGKTGTVSYTDEGSGKWLFIHTATDGTQAQERHQAREGGGRGGEGRPGRAKDRPPRGKGERPAQSGAAGSAMDALKRPVTGFDLSSPEIPDPTKLPLEFTGDGAGISPPLAWRGAPPETRSFAIVMDHLTPDGSIKCYWTMWDIPATTAALPKNSRAIGKLGAGFRGATGYEPPKSQGPGPKNYVITLYALSAAPAIAQQSREVTREVLLAAIKDSILGSASLPVTYTRNANDVTAGDRPQPPQREHPQRAGDAGIIKATMADVVKGSVYADNWFALYINGRLVAVDSIAFLPHNVVSVDILPEYPMTLAVIAHDNTDPKTGLEYGTQMGDGGFILKFADGTVTDGTWKAKAIERGPIGGDLTAPRVENDPRPEAWQMPAFDDSQWEQARVFSEQEVNPKQPFYEADFKGAQFIWSRDLATDNTVLFRKRIEKPGWTPRWNAQPSGQVPSP